MSELYDLDRFYIYFLPHFFITTYDNLFLYENLWYNKNIKISVMNWHYNLMLLLINAGNKINNNFTC